MAAIKCKHCGEEPGFCNQSMSSGEVYWALECDCKSTDYYRSKMWSIAEWKDGLFEKEPSERYRHPELHT